jgi:DNA-binding Lrp family transcriptional regulator
VAVTIDALDEQIIALLREDGRASFADIAQQVGLSGDAVRARVGRLTADGVVRFIGLVHPASLGLVALGSAALSYEGSASDFVARVADHPAITFVAQTVGSANALCEIAAAGDEEFSDVISESLATIPGVRVHDVWQHVEVVKWDSQTRPHPAPGASAARPPRDEVDVQLLQELVADPRASYRELEARTGHPYHVVRRRTQGLFEDRVIEATATVDRLSTRGEYRAYLRMRLGHSWDEALERLAAIDELKILVLTTGPDNATGEIACTSREMFSRVIRRVASVPGVEDVRTYPYSRILVLPAQWRFDLA